MLQFKFEDTANTGVIRMEGRFIGRLAVDAASSAFLPTRNLGLICIQFNKMELTYKDHSSAALCERDAATRSSDRNRIAQ